MTEKIRLDDKQIRSHLHKIVRDMTRDNWRPDYIVGLTRGGLIAGVMLSQYLEIPLHTLNVSLRDADIGPESNLWMAEDAFGHLDYDPMCSGDGRKQILIVDDINDTGATLNWVMDDWQSGCYPDNERWNLIWNNSVRFATIVDNLASKCKVKMNYVGMEINKEENPSWIVFPWEAWWEN